jgi:hypothetical protein
MIQKCPNCGAESTPIIKDSQAICQFCGTTIPIGQDSKKFPNESQNSIGYQPDPPPPYDNKREEDALASDSKDIPVINPEAAMDIPPELVSTVANSGRKIARYGILVVVILIALCSACFIISSYLN